MKGSKGKITTVVVILVTLILAGVAIFTAIRLYQLRQTSVSPLAPSSRPKAQEAPSCSLSFTITPTESPNPSVKTCSDNIGDDFSESTLDVTKWSVYKGNDGGGSAVITNGQLVITYPNDSGTTSSANVSTVSNISGDFDITVDFVSQQSSGSGGGEQIVISDSNDSLSNRVVIYRNVGNTLGAYYTQGGDTKLGEKTINSVTGIVTVRVVRSGNTFTTYYKTGSDFTEIAEFSGAITGDTVVRLSAFSASATDDVTGIFDNFTIACLTTPSTSPSASPTASPSSPPGATPNSCGGTCGSNFNCASDLVCFQGSCRNPDCTSSVSCVCGGTSTSTSTPAPSLPQSGTDWPTVAGFGVGIFVIIGSLLLAL